MENERPAAPAPRVFEIAYQNFSGTHRNHDFRGKGSLAIAADGSAFVFSGDARGALRRSAQLSFAPDQIWNVLVDGRRIQFATKLGASGTKGQPFNFFCPDERQAAEISALLPRHQDADTQASQEFIRQLRELPAARSPWTSVTTFIVIANVVAFVFMGLNGAGWFGVADLMPYIRFGANRADITTDGEWWRLLASMFLHYGLVHLALNMWALVQAGQLAEKLFGRTLYAALYFGSGLAGSVATLLWHSKNLVWSAGASGAVFGVYGGFIGLMLRQHHALPKTVFQPLFKSTAAFAGYNLLYGLVHPAIDNAAHIGGLLGGTLLGWLFALPLDREARAHLIPRRLQFGAGAVALILVTGVALTPRFDYSISEELAWQAANKASVVQEQAILQRQQKELATFKTNGTSGRLVAWLADEAIPFYSKWQDELQALKLTPGRATAKRRNRLEDILRLKIAAYTHLRDALVRGEETAFAQFNAEEQAIAEQLRQLAAKAK